MSGDSEQGEAQGQGTAGETESSTGETVCYGIGADRSGGMLSPNPHSGIYKADTSRTLDANGGNPSCYQGGIMVLNDQGGEQMSVSHDKTSTLRANTKHHEPTILATNHQHDRIYNGESYVLDDTNERPAVLAFSQNGEGVTAESPIVNSLTVRQNPAGRGTAQIYGFQPNAGGRTELAINKNIAPCLNAGQTAGMFSETYQRVTGCLNPGAHPGSYNGQDAYNDMLVSSSFARRLTPLECERLQGYPDGWVDIGDWTDSRGKRHKESDAPKYKALGNSIALPFWQWLMDRIITECDEKTMVSLFDGIGGFPLCWQRSGGETLWVSEIDEFCNAVTQRRFT